MAKAKPSKSLPDGHVKARVLVACEHGQPNDVAIVEQSVCDAAIAAGLIDVSAAAVEYAESLLPEAA